MRAEEIFQQQQQPQHYQAELKAEAEAILDHQVLLQLAHCLRRRIVVVESGVVGFGVCGWTLRSSAWAALARALWPREIRFIAWALSS